VDRKLLVKEGGVWSKDEIINILPTNDRNCINSHIVGKRLARAFERDRNQEKRAGHSRDMVEMLKMRRLE